MIESIKKNYFVILTALILFYETYYRAESNILLVTSLVLILFLGLTFVKKIYLDDFLFILCFCFLLFTVYFDNKLLYFQILLLPYLIFQSKYYFFKVIFSLLALLFDVVVLKIEVLSNFTMIYGVLLFFFIIIRFWIDKLYYQINELSITDDLTGLLNQKGFLRKFEEEYYRSVRYKKSFTLIMLDSDDLKKVNDTYGHKYGTKVILFIAEEIKKNIRRTDFACRYGGDEFMICLVETPLNNGKIFADRLRKSIAIKPVFTEKGKGFNVTISLGVVGFPDTSEKSYELLDLVDKALYDAKNKGKNKVVVLTKNSAE
ncbi:GGDEF domain-containing protein [Deferribacter thermophilus]|uniref:GGDEF domain-containing protein n=1 Tax=Deferribacter thermophilus TaxID=53573 RepID=UPI003C29FD4F